VLTSVVNFPRRRAPSPQIRARDTPNDGAANGTAGVNSAPDVDAGVDGDPPPLKWSDLRYVFDIKEDCNGKEAIQA
jgi:hypothetical protein